MVIYSAHDSTISSQVLFLLHFFNVSLDKYIFPKYATQISYEVTRDDYDKYKNDNKILSYSDYNVSFFYNDEKLFEVKFYKFVETIKNNIFNDIQIDDYCFLRSGWIQRFIFSNYYLIISILGIVNIISIYSIYFLINQLKFGFNNYDFNEEEKEILMEEQS